MPIAVPPVIVDGFVPVVDLSAASGSSADQRNFEAVIEPQPSAAARGLA
jgi:hypothetical protein